MPLLIVKWPTLCHTLICNVSQIMREASSPSDGGWKIWFSFTRSTREHQNDFFCFSLISITQRNLQPKYIRFYRLNLLYISSLRLWCELKAVSSPHSPVFVFFHLPTRILQFKNFHQHKRSSMWNRLMRRNKANPRGLTSNRKRMCMRRRGNSLR